MDAHVKAYNQYQMLIARYGLIIPKLRIDVDWSKNTLYVMR